MKHEGFYFFCLSKPDFSSDDPTQPGKMNKAIIYGPLIAVFGVASLSFAVYRTLSKKRRNCKLHFELPPWLKCNFSIGDYIITACSLQRIHDNTNLNFFLQVGEMKKRPGKKKSDGTLQNVFVQQFLSISLAWLSKNAASTRRGTITLWHSP